MQASSKGPVGPQGWDLAVLESGRRPRAGRPPRSEVEPGLALRLQRLPAQVRTGLVSLYLEGTLFLAVFNEMESHGVFLSQVRVNVYYENSTRPGLPQAYLRSVHISVLCLQWFRVLNQQQ